PAAREQRERGEDGGDSHRGMGHGQNEENRRPSTCAGSGPDLAAAPWAAAPGRRPASLGAFWNTGMVLIISSCCSGGRPRQVAVSTMKAMDSQKAMASCSSASYSVALRLRRSDA